MRLSACGAGCGTGCVLVAVAGEGSVFMFPGSEPARTSSVLNGLLCAGFGAGLMMTSDVEDAVVDVDALKTLASAFATTSGTLIISAPKGLLVVPKGLLVKPAGSEPNSPLPISALLGAALSSSSNRLATAAVELVGATFISVSASNRFPEASPKVKVVVSSGVSASVPGFSGCVSGVFASELSNAALVPCNCAASDKCSTHNYHAVTFGVLHYFI